jgi:hypothetical protein
MDVPVKYVWMFDATVLFHKHYTLTRPAHIGSQVHESAKYTKIRTSIDSAETRKHRRSLCATVTTYLPL